MSWIIKEKNGSELAVSFCWVTEVGERKQKEGRLVGSVSLKVALLGPIFS